MNLQDYIATGILEKYLLGLATPQEMTEVDDLRRLSPEIRTELTEIEKRIERMHLDAPVQPPAMAFPQVMQRLQWEMPPEDNIPRPTHKTAAYTLLPNRTITVSIWWRCAFVAVVIIAIASTVAAMYFYHRAEALEQLFWRR